MAEAVIPLDVGDVLDLLSRTPDIVRAQIEGLPETWLEADEGPDTFSARDNVAHLAYGERVDWMPRLRIILEHGEERPFDPFDRRAHRAFFAGAATGDLLDEFAALRSKNLAELRDLLESGMDLERTGRHPELGRVSVRQLLAAWVVHDLGHVRQIARVLARQYGGDVGPWRAYLPVLG